MVSLLFEQDHDFDDTKLRGYCDSSARLSIQALRRSAQSAERDKRCLIEAHLAGLKPIAVSDRGATVNQALDAAADTIEQTRNRKLGRLHDTKVCRTGKAM